MNEKAMRVLEYNKIVDMLKNKVTSTLGKELIEDLRPSNDLELVRNSLAETSDALGLIIKKGSFPIGPIYDINRYLRLTSIGSYLNPKQLLDVSDTLRTARVLKRFILTDSELESPLRGLAEAITTFKNIEDRIEEVVVGVDEISDHASSTLRNIRRQKDSKQVAIRNKLNALITSQSTQKYLQDAIITIRQDRFVLPVKAENKRNIPGLIHDQSASGQTLYIEPMVIVDMNNELKELGLKERAEIERILRELSAQIAEIADEAVTNQDILIQLDFIGAKGKLALDMNGVEPKLNTRGYVRIKNGKHPMLDKKTVVPSNIWLGKNFNTLLITGPNTGGKTVTLKTLGLFCLMAQSGLLIPADHGTELCVFNNIYADIGDEQSIEQSLSTFSSHMTNITGILEEVTHRDLVILDELGAGTDPTEGAALAMAILTYLFDKGVRTVATTHYSELKEYALTKNGVENACVEFDIDTLSPTYKLLIGIPGKSNALEISRRLGLSEDIISASRELIKNEDIEFENIITKIEADKKLAEQERDEAIVLKLEVQKLKNKYEEKYKKLQEKTDKEVKKAKEDAKKIIKEAKEEADTVIKELRNISSEVTKDRNKRLEELRKGLKTKLDDLYEPVELFDESDLSEPPSDVKIGDKVKVVTLNQEGVVVGKSNKKEVTVQIGMMKLNLKLTNLRLIKKKKEKQTGTSIAHIVKSKADNIKRELDLRGQNIEEAIIEVDKYLDDVYLAKAEEVFIIHGKGTGALRKGLKEFLRRHKHVKSFRDGNYNEGGNGVTVVELK